MSTAFSLDSLRERATVDYKSVFIDLGEEEVELVNILRLPKSVRTQVSEAQDALSGETGETVDVVEVLERLVRLVAKDAVSAENLINQVDGDASLLATIFKVYTEGTQAGEAPASQD